MANRFWVGGTGTWDNSTTTHWSASTGGAGGASVPVAGDVVLFDGASGGGTVSVNAAINAGNSLASIDMTAFTGTLDFSSGNPTITLTGNGFQITGTSSRVLTLGSSTIILTGTNAAVWNATTITGLTFNAGTSNIVFQPGILGGGINVNVGTLTYATMTFGPVNFATTIAVQNNGATFTTLSISGPIILQLPNLTITNAVNWAGTAANLITVRNTLAGTASTVTLSAAGGTASWLAIGGITFATNSLTASNSFNLSNVTNATITNPSVGGGGAVIGS